MHTRHKQGENLHATARRPALRAVDLLRSESCLLCSLKTMYTLPPASPTATLKPLLPGAWQSRMQSCERLWQQSLDCMQSERSVHYVTYQLCFKLIGMGLGHQLELYMACSTHLPQRCQLFELAGQSWN